MDEVSTEVSREAGRYSLAFEYEDRWGGVYKVHKIVEANSPEEAIGTAILERTSDGEGRKGTSSDWTWTFGREFKFTKDSVIKL